MYYGFNEYYPYDPYYSYGYGYGYPYWGGANAALTAGFLASLLVFL